MESAPLTADCGYLSEHEKGIYLSGDVGIQDYDSDVATALEHRLQVSQFPGDIMVSLDRMTITGGLAYDQLWRFEEWLAHSSLPLSMTDANPPYRYQHRLADRGGLLQYVDAGTTAQFDGTGLRLRYDFNPAHVSVAQAADVLQFFDRGRNLTRVDVAVDYPVNLAGYSFDVPRCSRQTFHGASGELETVYLGRPGSKRRFRCYNKAKEREFAGQILPPGCEWWRCEVVWRPQRGDDDFPLTLFDDLAVLAPSSLATGHWKDLYALRYCLEHPEAVKALHWRPRAKVKEGMEALCVPLHPSPADVYRDSFSALAKIFCEYLYA